MIGRIVKLIVSAIPGREIGKLKEYTFKASEGALARFLPTIDEDTEISVSLQTCGVEGREYLWNAQELRELAEECNKMAKYLEEEL